MLRSVLVQASLFVILCAGCADEPTSVGSRLLPTSDFLKADSTIIPAAASSSVRARPIEFIDRIRITIGKNGSTESWGLLLFGFADSLKDVVVQEAVVKLRTNYHFGDSLGQFSVAVRKALRNWTIVSFTYDSLRASGAYEPTAIPGQNFGSIGDTSDIALTIDTAVVGSWLRNINEAENKNFGLVVEPTNALVIKGFVSSSPANISVQKPTLEIRYTRPGSMAVDTVRIAASADRFLASSSDTSFTTDSTNSSIRNGLAYRGKLDFNISSIPAHAGILKASLEVTANGAGSAIYSADSLLAIFMTEFGFPETTPELRFPPAALSEVLTSGGQKVYRFHVTEFVQAWVRSYPVRSIAIAGLTEANSLDVFGIHGAASPTAAFRPRLVITYSAPR